MPAGLIRSHRRSLPSHLGPAGAARGGRVKPAAIAGTRDSIEEVRALLLNNVLVERLSRTFRALGDPTRSKLVLALSLQEMCVSELAEALGSSLSATSHQLRILRDLDLVRVRRSGRSQLYVLNEQAFGPCSPRSCMAWRRTLAPEQAARNDVPVAAPRRATGRSPARDGRRHDGRKG
ncbi:MAG: winged helix-turn-helix transcriptional regulator [Candidatus Eisenbacteria bacterium]|uniref:Winged helix-turn-helix transcriptional regulator n=1 Tax=Eiseniibacteriota bacterium TaxID=2212470 RepID=A0A538SAK6_UNCEI|nr:MAG: winged helix-turn-helix transcriptional regulator [Candidatus Eisenbacteria bacterium]